MKSNTLTYMSKGLFVLSKPIIEGSLAFINGRIIGIACYQGKFSLLFPWKCISEMIRFHCRSRENPLKLTVEKITEKELYVSDLEEDSPFPIARKSVQSFADLIPKRRF